jgi:hypothetical protein
LLSVTNSDLLSRWFGGYKIFLILQILSHFHFHESDLFVRWKREKNQIAFWTSEEECALCDFFWRDRQARLSSTILQSYNFGWPCAHVNSQYRRNKG